MNRRLQLEDIFIILVTMKMLFSKIIWEFYFGSEGLKESVITNKVKMMCMEMCQIK